ncbi:MAG: FISUMP domain-containing protein, partial [Bacteroidota bacterium]
NNITLYIDTTVFLGENYTYRIYAFDGNKCSQTIEQNINLAFGAPTNFLIYQLTGTSLQLTWRDNSLGEDGFKIDRMAEGGNWENEIATVASNQTIYTDNTVIWNTSYTYRVYAYSGDNYTTKAEKTIIINFVPTNLQIENVSGTSLKLTWQDNSLGEDGFKIDRMTEGGAWENEFASVPANMTSYTDNSIIWNTSYTYRVYAYSGINITEKTEKNIEIDFTPTNLQINQISGASLQLNWQDNSLGEDGFKIDRKVESGNWENGIATATANQTNFTDNTVLLNTSYTYRVFAYLGSCVSDYAESYMIFISDCIDYNGNFYPAVQIGNQIWMKENLKSIHYSDGSTISGVYAYDNNESNVATYGRLYTWAAVMNGAGSSNDNPSGVQGVCPDGWHVPSDAEWTQLTDYLGGAGVAGDKMKEAGTAHWNSPNTGATNESGFTALPGGYRHLNGGFSSIGYYGYWWSSSELVNSSAWSRHLYYSGSNVSRSYGSENYGFSVRCLRDN